MGVAVLVGGAAVGVGVGVAVGRGVGVAVGATVGVDVGAGSGVRVGVGTGVGVAATVDWDVGVAACGIGVGAGGACCPPHAATSNAMQRPIRTQRILVMS